MGEVDFKESAVTEISAEDWLFVANNAIAHMKQAAQQETWGDQDENAKNFKKFKKNYVIYGARIHNISQIHLVSVLSKESERQKELQSMQSELEREQHVANMLFENDGGTGRNKSFRIILRRQPVQINVWF